MKYNYCKDDGDVPAPLAPPDNPPDKPPERELKGANFEAKALERPLFALEKKVVALFITGPILAVPA